MDVNTISDAAINDRLERAIDANDGPMRVMVKDAAELTLETQITHLGEASTVEDLAVTINRLAFYLEQGKRLKEQLDQTLIAWINANGSFEVGDFLYYVGQTKGTPKCINVAATLNECLNLTGGSVDDVAATYLGSQPFKYGAFKSAAGPDVYAKHFIIEAKPKLEREEKKLKVVDQKFLG